VIKSFKTLFPIRFNVPPPPLYFRILFKENYTIKKFEKIQGRLNINHKLINKFLYYVNRLENLHICKRWNCSECNFLQSSRIAYPHSFRFRWDVPGYGRASVLQVSRMGAFREILGNATLFAAR